MRPYDIAARIGGEEFCILLPRTGIAQALAVADRLRLELASKAVGTVAGGAGSPQASASYRGEPASETLKMMMTAADRKLYAAKNAGRNTVQWGVAEMPGAAALKPSGSLHSG